MLFFTLVQMLPWMALATYEEKPSLRIIGGGPISIEEAPYMALFRPVGGKFHCGASIVSEQFLITAAHCAGGQNQWTVTVGTDKADSGQNYEVEKVVLHPRYMIPPANNDIAVIKLKKKMTFSDRVRPIKLAEPGIAIEEDAKFRAAGFGRTSIDGSDSNQLLSVEVNHMSKANCSSYFPPTFQITDQMICAGEVKKGVCNGDSGGPLVYGDKQVGVTSFTRRGCKPPSVFARVSALRDFIDKVIRDES